METIGTQSELIKEVQGRLKHAAESLPNSDLDPGPVDGIHGPKTEAAAGAYAAQFCIDREAGTLPPALVEHLQGGLWAPLDPPGVVESHDSGAPPSPSGGAHRPIFGAFLWQADKVSTAELLSLCRVCKVDRIMPKVMNKHGRQMYRATLDKHIPALLDAGIEVVPWAYLDDDMGASDARRLAEIAREYGCDGAVANMEREIVDGDTPAERRHDAQEIDDVLTVLSEELPGFIGFSSFRRRDFFPFPKGVFLKHSERVTFMNQCYNQQTPKQSARRTIKSAESWLEWPKLRVRTTLGAFPAKASQNGSFGSMPAGMIAGGRAIQELAATNDRLDAGFDWWTIEHVRVGYAPVEYRRAMAAANTPKG